ncbi:MAG: aminoacyl-tRNA hydrolase [Gammaproteobacteria bacterium RIFCSPHIGHO2_12_FULL_38_11]|nr:MAG: aminoacyl-tRNA hydrolase [Gammaproteobacteria bacterium RIFCSPHIGHO2_12_FULL_38_11]
MTQIQCIIGLGNPGSDYAKTRHNVGAWFVDFLAEKENAPLRLEKKLRGMLSEFLFNHQKCFLFKPTTYMNESGLSVSALLNFYKIPIENVLVAHDELDFDAGIARLKKGGGHGGHNGLRDIIQKCASADFYRLRLGIGHPGNRDDVVDYVLNVPSKDDHQKIIMAIEDSTRVIPELLSGEIQKAFHQLHSD